MSVVEYYLWQTSCPAHLISLKCRCVMKMPSIYLKGMDNKSTKTRNYTNPIPIIMLLKWNMLMVKSRILEPKTCHISNFLRVRNYVNFIANFFIDSPLNWLTVRSETHSSCLPNALLEQAVLSMQSWNCSLLAQYGVRNQWSLFHLQNLNINTLEYLKFSTLS